MRGRFKKKKANVAGMLQLPGESGRSRQVGARIRSWRTLWEWQGLTCDSKCHRKSVSSFELCDAMIFFTVLKAHLSSCVATIHQCGEQTVDRQEWKPGGQFGGCSHVKKK